jgi:hypothetical protein
MDDPWADGDVVEYVLTIPPESAEHGVDLGFLIDTIREDLGLPDPEDQIINLEHWEVEYV